MGFSLSKSLGKIGKTLGVGSLEGMLGGGIFGSEGPIGGAYGANFWDPLDISGTTARQYQAEQAKTDRDWQEKMSNTAHQREVADLRAAGLNPILTATGGNGASTPGGAMAGNATGAGIGDLVGLLQAFNTMKANKITAKQQESQQQVNDTTIENLQDEIKNRGINTASNVARNNAEIMRYNAETRLTIAKARGEETNNLINDVLGISNNEQGVNRSGAWGVHATKGIAKQRERKITDNKEIKAYKAENQRLAKENKAKNTELIRRMAKSGKFSQAELSAFINPNTSLLEKRKIMKRGQERGFK